MRVEELMVGDLCRVNKDVCIKKDTIVKVCAIDAWQRLEKYGLEGSTTCIPLNGSFHFSGGVWAEYLDAIPLTPEILEKNDFKKQSFEGWLFWKYQNDDYTKPSLYSILWMTDYGVPHLQIRSFSDKYGDFTKSDIHYVHQLQHAFRLCGIEKEFVI